MPMRKYIFAFLTLKFLFKEPEGNDVAGEPFDIKEKQAASKLGTSHVS